MRRPPLALLMPLLAAASLLLAACGSESEPAAGAATSTATGTATATATAEVTPTATPEAPQTRTIETALGPVEIPTDPQRVVALGLTAFPEALAVGVTPVAATTNVPSILRDELEGIEVQLDPSEPDIEAIAAANPDLILALAFDGAVDNLDQLQQIAPVVAFPFESSAQWKEYFLFFADALNRSEEAQQALAAYDARVAEVREAIGPALAETEVRILRVRADQIRVMLPDSFAGTVVHGDVGLPAAPAPAEGSFAVDLSPELAGQLDADVLFLWTFGATPQAAEAEQAGLRALDGNPLWQRLEAVQDGRVHVVGDHWIGGSLFAAHAILDELEAALGQ